MSVSFRHILLSLLLVAAGSRAFASADADSYTPTLSPDDIEEIEARGARKKALQGYYFFTDDAGDEQLMLVLSDVTVYPPIKFKNKKEEEFYWKTVRDVRKTLPYAKLICETLIETY